MHTEASIDAYAQGGTLAEEIFSSIRNAVAFGTQKKLADNYDKHLKIAEGFGIKHRGILGSMLGVRQHPHDPLLVSRLTLV